MISLFFKSVRLGNFTWGKMAKDNQFPQVGKDLEAHNQLQTYLLGKSCLLEHTQLGKLLGIQRH